MAIIQVTVARAVGGLGCNSPVPVIQVESVLDACINDLRHKYNMLRDLNQNCVLTSHFYFV